MSDLQSHSLPRAMKTGRTGENLGTWDLIGTDTGFFSLCSFGVPF